MIFMLPPTTVICVCVSVCPVSVSVSLCVWWGDPSPRPGLASEIDGSHDTSRRVDFGYAGSQVPPHEVEDSDCDAANRRLFCV